MNTKLYNDTSFSAKFQHAFTSNYHDKYSTFIDTIASKLHKKTRTRTPVAELFQYSGNMIPTIEYIEATALKQQSSHIINFNDIIHNKLFFIQYTPDGTMQRRWYPIQINTPSTKEINPNYLQDHIFWCLLLAKHLQDSNKKRRTQ